MLVRGRYAREACPTRISGESLTEQSHGAGCDINSIVARHARSGGIPPPSVPPQYADVTKLQMPLQQRIAFAERITQVTNEFFEDKEAALAADAKAAADAAAAKAATPPA